MIDPTPSDMATASPEDDAQALDHSAAPDEVLSPPAVPTSGALAAPDLPVSPVDGAGVVVVDEITLVSETPTGSLPTVRATRASADEPAAPEAARDDADPPQAAAPEGASPADHANLPAEPDLAGSGAPLQAGSSSGSLAAESVDAASIEDAAAAPSAIPDVEATGAADEPQEPAPPQDDNGSEYQVYTSDHLSSLADRLAFRAYQTLPFSDVIPSGPLASAESAPVLDDRTAELARRLTIEADVRAGILPFNDIEPRLTRAEIEWLLATHESNGFVGPVDWNDPAQRKRIGLDLRGADLRDVDLSGLILTRARLGPTGGEWLGATQPGRDWAAAHLEGANLLGTHLEGALLRGTHLQGAHLTGAVLTEATIIRADLERADLREAELTGADLSEARLAHADLSSADMPRANLHAAHLDGALLRNANLTGADLHGAHLERAELDNAHLEHANLNAARLDGASLTVALMDGASLVGAHLEWASLNSIHLDGALMSGAHLEHATLNGAYLRQADLQETHLEGADLRGAHLEGADLRRAVLDEQTTLADVSLSDPQAGPAALGDVRWSGVDLTVVDWDPVARLGDERVVGKRANIAALRAVVRAYRQVAAQLRAQGMHEEADRYAYRALVRRRDVLLHQGKAPQWFFATFLRFFSGFGYKPARALVWYFALVVGCAVGYLAAAQTLLAGASLAQWWQALVVSVTAFHGRGFFQPVAALGDPAALLMLIESVIGLLLEVSFLISLAQRHLGAK